MAEEFPYSQLLFVQTLQLSYYNNMDFSVEVSNTQRICCCVVNKTTDYSIDLRNIPGLPGLESFDEDRSVLVVFFELEPNSKFKR